jgi:hypothetical protein
VAVARQRGKGEGSIYFEAATGRWRGAVVLPDGARRRVSARTKKECRDRLRAVQLEVERGLPSGPSRLTLEDFLTRWSEDVLPARARVRSTNTIDNHRYVVRTHLIPALGPKLLWSLTPDDVERLLRATVSPSRHGRFGRGRSRSGAGRRLPRRLPRSLASSGGVRR